MARYRLGVDVGGTNTDLVLHDGLSGAQLVEKLPTTPSNPAAGVLEGIGRFVARGVSPNEIGFFAHGTTVTTNALLELKGVRIGLFITDGYTGVIDVQTQTRSGNMFDFTFQRPASLVSPDLIREIRGRIDSSRPRGAAARFGGGPSWCGGTSGAGNPLVRCLLYLQFHESCARTRDRRCHPDCRARRDRFNFIIGHAPHS